MFQQGQLKHLIKRMYYMVGVVLITAGWFLLLLNTKGTKLHSLTLFRKMSPLFICIYIHVKNIHYKTVNMDDIAYYLMGNS